MDEYQKFYDFYWKGEDAGEPCPSCRAAKGEPHGDCEYPEFVRATYGIG